MRTVKDSLRSDTGTAVLEFALVVPVALFLIFGLIYGGLAAAAHVSLAHATSRAVRFASIPVDAVSGVYPPDEAVAERVDDETPFFTAAACETLVSPDTADNAPVSLDVSCDFPNPAGRALSALKGFFTGADASGAYVDAMQISAHAEARRE